jgi:Phosphotransferase enzyme family
MSNELRDHPAVQAWRRVPDSSDPARVETVTKEPSNATFRIHHGKGSGPPTIAKRRWRECLETEQVIYQRVLPQLPIPPVRCLGFVSDQDPERAWLFIEDVGGEPYRSDEVEHQVLAARWLAETHAFGMTESNRVLLPDRGPAHYLGLLRESCTAINSRFGCDDFDSEDRRILLATVRGLAELEERWDMVEEWCDAMPRTLVHGDFVTKNCRVRRTSNLDLELVVFDWETAGWGSPAVDLATNALGNCGMALDYATYVHAGRGAWAGVGERELQQAARIGDAQRVVAAIQWACESLVYPWVVQAELRFYLPHLEDAVRLVRGNGVRRPRVGVAAG